MRVRGDRDRKRIAEFAVKHRLPTVTNTAAYIKQGSCPATGRTFRTSTIARPSTSTESSEGPSLIGHRFQNPCDGMRNARLKREDAFSHAMIIVSSAMVSSS